MTTSPQMIHVPLSGIVSAGRSNAKLWNRILWGLAPHACSSRNGQGTSPLPVLYPLTACRGEVLLGFGQMCERCLGVLRGDIGMTRLPVLHGFCQMLDRFGQMWVLASPLGMIP